MTIHGKLMLSWCADYGEGQEAEMQRIAVRMSVL